ncbi:DUF2461 domain-containing protein [Mucilaginibacter arboris]|uniref:TIGR02453 family protein n=1 Tax=Mucilaginibacter arboris TaxID=2682090 RepID=A0A7K1SV71_9SPHI|nr:DUF2461 domain-containing protein [Mucilaginibacter arboris]MVN21138.1 TIGR02453 family protein [Mucilaginibacter arboris]
MIKAETFDFLKSLAENNNRDWFTANKAVYEDARENVLDFTKQLIRQLAKTDPQVNADTDPKKCVMRIYRDIRFSKDKTPYKSNFGINIKTGSGNTELGYYLHIQPDKSFVGGGYWMPTPEHLKAIRQEIDYNGAALNAIISDASFIDDFSAFDQQEQLKNNPKGYEADHPYLNLLKLKSFAAIHHLNNEELMDKMAIQNVVKYLAKIQPLNHFLIQALH